MSAPNVRLSLTPLSCPRPGCGRPLQPMMNGGSTIYLRCEQDPPKCGLIIPAETALAWVNEQRIDADATTLETTPVQHSETIGFPKRLH